MELKLHAVKLCMEEGYSESEISQALGVANGTLYRWLDRYLLHIDALRSAVVEPDASV